VYPVPTALGILAALGPRALALAGDRSSGAHPYLTPPEHTADARRILGPSKLLVPEQKVLLEVDGARAREEARQLLEFYLRLPNYLNSLRRYGFDDRDFVDGGSDRLVDRLVAWGDGGTVAARVREHHDAGADHVVVQVLPTAPGHLPRAEWKEAAAVLLG
jgi:probable F420-dependent oxidoreductase